MVKPIDIAKEFYNYPQSHPLGEMAKKIYDGNDFVYVKDSSLLVKFQNEVNSFNSIGRALCVLEKASSDAYEDMMQNKLLVKRFDVDGMHILVSALAELSLMNTFIIQTTDKNSFKYEQRLSSKSDKNVEFSIIIGGMKFNIEVKTANLIKWDKEIVDEIHKNGECIVAESRLADYEEKKKLYPKMKGCPAGKMKDFLESANSKFVLSSANEINLLIVLWDDRVGQAIKALKSPLSEGLLTKKSFNRDAQNNIKSYPNIDGVIVNSGYELFKMFVIGCLYNTTSPVYFGEPFHQLFTNNYLFVNNRKVESYYNLLNGIFQTQISIPTEDDADKLPSLKRATIELDGVIKFRELESIQ